jgi:DNA-directed RNA polymerase specialized sigma54-like protein
MLKDLFRTKSSFVIDKIKEVVESGGGAMTDNCVADALRAAYGIRISRRTVNLYRTKAGI